MTAEHRFEESDELRLLVCASSFPEAAAEAGRALAQFAAGGAPPPSDPSWREIAVEAPDRAALLVEWINELIYRAEAEGWLGVEFEMRDGSGGRLQARVRGIPWPTRSVPVKAATLDRAQVTEGPDGVTARVTLDI
ncbi:MAG: archease [Gemmatimonadales bacterium]